MGRQELVVKARIPPRRPGKPRRKVTNTYARQSALTKQMGGVVTLDLVNGIETFKRRISAEELADAWAKKDYQTLLQAIPWDELPADVVAGLSKLGLAVEKAAGIQREALPPNVDKALRFDVANPQIRSYLDRQSATLVTRIGDDTRHMIQGHIARAFTNARTPRQVANSIKGGIGLLPKHEAAVERYHAGLLAAGTSETRADALAAKYEEKLLDYRAMMIGRTEVRSAVNFGQLAVWRQGADQGLIDRVTAQKEWVVDGNPCEVCEPMDGERVGLDETWTLEYENGDTAEVEIPTESHPHCECGMELHFGETTDEENAE